MNGVPINKATVREHFVVSEAEADDVADLRNAARLTARVGAIALFLEGGAGGAMISSNILGKVGVTEPEERFSLALAGGGGLEYQLQNRHYAFGLGGEYWQTPGFTGLGGVTVRLFLRYTYGGSR